MYCIKAHIHFQVSQSTSEIFNKNLKIGRFYPGLPYVNELRESNSESNMKIELWVFSKIDFFGRI